VTALALVVALAGPPLAVDNGCRCTDLDPTLAAFTRLAAAAVLASTGRALTCHNGRRRGRLHEQGRAVDLVLDGTWNYRRTVAEYEAGGSTRAALSTVGQLAAWTGMRWGLAAWGRLDEVGHFERPAGFRWPVPGLLLAVLPAVGGCR
jgi:hypothetical protein